MNVVHSLGYETILTSDKDIILSADKIIFPGQGHFGQAMEKLNQLGLVDVIKEAINSGKQFLGISLQVIRKGRCRSGGREKILQDHQ